MAFMQMKEVLIQRLSALAEEAGLAADLVTVGYPEDATNGDFTTNLALVGAKSLKLSPRALADKLIAAATGKWPDFVAEVSVAGPGFINFKIKPDSLTKQIIMMASHIKSGAKSGDWLKSNLAEMRAGEAGAITAPVMIEYTDPNIFKVFHIGHLMSNTIGESISRLIEASGTPVIRLCYPADIGLHVAKAVWAVQKNLSEMPADQAPIALRTAFLGRMYVLGTQTYDADPVAKAEIDELNKKLYEGTDPAVQKIYHRGRTWSLDHFEELYRILGTKFDTYFYESNMAPIGLSVVRQNLGKVFVESDGAIVFHGEEHGLHTRVFVNSHGLPTYEAKDLGLNITKFEHYPEAAQSIIVTASEQNEYFKVMLKVLSLVDERDGSKTKHIGHGMMRFASGKMSSRTGNVITAESLLSDMRELVRAKMAERAETLDPGEADKIATQVAIAAIKYTILRQTVGSDIVFDSAKSISFEGDSGPYLQYAAVRAAAVLAKANAAGIKPAEKIPASMVPGQLERLLGRFADVMARAGLEQAPQLVATYLIELAAAFNSFYSDHTIADPAEPQAPYRVALVQTFLAAMTDGLWLLGITVPRLM